MNDAYRDIKAMRRALGVVILALLVSSCSDAKRVLGYERSVPDEFSVVSRAPLSQPPDYSLRPPQPGAPRPQEGMVRDQARNMLLSSRSGGATENFADRSTGEQALLSQAGADRALPDIRKVVNEETTSLIEADNSFTDKILFWQKKPLPGEALDAKGERQRLQDNAALGKSVSDGETPQITRRKKGWLEGVF
ncbi:MAG: DUF3035 domain-containing protein [Rhodospirillaceae bacterium]|nr:DUF3035 domain-containing protein [Rhodospirillaceae bacterium]